MAVLSEVAAGETMTIGSTGNSQINELAAFVIQETGVDLDPVYEEAKEADARHTHADVSKAQSSIGYEP